MQKFQTLARAIAMVGQLGFTIITPPFVLILLADYLVSQHGWGIWVLVAAILLGLGCSVSGAWSFLRSVRTQQQKKEESESSRTVSFRKHI
ncbi:MAG: AtpZ/AtpI family protein [Clostridia bacterium]|nr:AtpZ/AtpI family protein [Clostridia bacterium]